MLRDAAADRQSVWLGYSDADGRVLRILFYPERVEGGRVHGTADGAARTLSIHRVTGAVQGCPAAAQPPPSALTTADVAATASD